MKEKVKEGRREEKYKALLICMRCGFEKMEMFDPKADEEKVCPKCGSNSIRIKKMG